MFPVIYIARILYVDCRGFYNFSWRSQVPIACGDTFIKFFYVRYFLDESANLTAAQRLHVHPTTRINRARANLYELYVNSAGDTSGLTNSHGVLKR